jgi:cell division transport system permease protein
MSAGRMVRYSFEEARASLWRGRSSSLLSTGTIAVALFVLGGFLVATSNLQRLGDEWSRAAEMSIYLDDEASAADRAGVELALQPGGVVAGYEFVSKEEALVRFKQTFADLATTVSSLEANPLPASYEVRFQPGAGGSASADGLASKLRLAPGVSDVRYDRQWLDRLLSIVDMMRVVGVALGTVLIVAAALTVGAVVRLALHARRDEIEIMQLVGAPQVRSRSLCHGGAPAGRRRGRRRPHRPGCRVLYPQAALPDPARRGGEPLIRPLYVSRALPDLPGRGDGGRLPRRAAGEPSSLIGEKSRYRILTPVLDRLYSGFIFGLLHHSRDLHATYRDRFKADQRAATDYRVLPTRVRPTSPLSPAAPTVFFRGRNH